MEDNSKKTKTLITILVAVIVLLLGIIIYAFVVQPTLTGYAVNKQIEGYQIAVMEILSEVERNGYVEIFAGENQSLILIPYYPEQDFQEDF